MDPNKSPLGNRPPDARTRRAWIREILIYIALGLALGLALDQPPERLYQLITTLAALLTP